MTTQNDKSELHKLAQNAALDDERVIVAKFTPAPKENGGYESERDLEATFIKQLVAQGYEYAAHIKDEAGLKSNLKAQIERLNNCKFSEREWERFFGGILAKKNDGIVEKTALVQENHIHNFAFDDGREQNIYLVDKANLQNNALQVISQYEVGAQSGAKYANRYDVSILVNGLPLVHCELKRRGVELKNAFYQIKRYGRESFFAGSGLFNFVQIFVISNGTFTKYYSNSTRDRHIKSLAAVENSNLGFGENVGGENSQNAALIAANSANDSFEFTSFWADEQNAQIYDLVDFTRTFFARHTILSVLFRYCVFDTSRNLLVMRAYQIAATEAILRKIKMALNYKHYGTDRANGYIWHSTGSGKTLTSFKTAQLVREMDEVAKVIFVVDRKDLDSQTVSEYNKFEKGCVEANKNTKMLEKKLKNRAEKIIVTTIQKLSYFIKGGGRGFCFDEPCVIIFDECHRSQFGEMNALIKKAFKKHLLFGFTGTPIMEANKTGFVFVQNDGQLQKMAQTTEGIFGECLHSYTIANAIKDKNVLPFKVDYNNLVAKFKKAEVEAGLFAGDLMGESGANSNLGENLSEDEKKFSENKKLLNHSERIKEIVGYVLKNFDKKTYRSGNYTTAQNKKILGFNSIFASASIESAKLYYTEFKRQNALLSEKEKLKIATIFSYGANEDVGSAEFSENSAENSGQNSQNAAKNSAQIQQNDKSSREFLDAVIKDYNEIFETNFDTSSEGFANYYNDISKKMKSKELDMLIVVDMFLTGFDAKTLNTLWVDKNLRYHSLLQAYSRTNRILDSTKQFGNIVCFRDLQEATNESIALFSQRQDNSEVVLMRSFKEYFEGYFEEIVGEKGEIIKEFHKGYAQITAEIKQKYENSAQLLSASKDEQKAFIKDINELLKIENILEVFDEFTEDKKLLNEREKQDLISAYLGIREQLKERSESGGNGGESFEDLVFEVAFLGQNDIDIEFIYKLLQKAKNESDESKREKLLDELARWVDSSLRLRGKGDLIKDFAREFVGLENASSEVDFIDEKFREFVKVRKKAEFAALVARENLNEKRARAFLEKAFKNGELSELGGEFKEILPAQSLFGKSDDTRIFRLISAFYEKYRDISSAKI